MLSLVSCNAYAMASCDQTLVEYNENRYAAVWTEIATKDYGLAMYHLDKIPAISAEDDMHQRLIKLMIFLRTGETGATSQMLEYIDQQAYHICLDENDNE